jgi:hypothetical protein
MICLLQCRVFNQVLSQKEEKLNPYFFFWVRLGLKYNKIKGVRNVKGQKNGWPLFKSQVMMILLDRR